MSADLETARGDAAFIRTLLETGDDGRRQFGEAYFAAGVCYTIQMFLHVGQALGVVSHAVPMDILIGAGPTVVYSAILIRILARSPRRAPSVVGRAVGAVFGAVGCANLALVAVIGWVAADERSLTTWLIYPCAVFVLQGAAWLVTFALRRRPWLALVAAGWFAAAIVMAGSVRDMTLYIAAAGVGMFACMAVPGWVLMRLARKAA